MRRSATFASLVASFIALVFLAAASASEAPVRRDIVSPDFAAGVLRGDVERLPNGLYRVTTPDGYVFTTHGPDTLALHDPDESLGPDDPQRPPVCATGHVAHILYGRPLVPGVFGADRYAEVADSFRDHLARMNYVLNESSLESGGPEMDLKVLCDENGEIRVDSFVNNLQFGYASTVFDAARQAGFDDPLVDYIIFYDDSFPGVCGFGEFSADDRPGRENRNNDGGYGVTYKTCWYGRTALHENGHTQGAVQASAPHHDGTNHCTEQRDIMCYPSTSSQCAIEWFDCGFDTYFDSAPEAGEWLATHWNLGSSANNYVSIGGTPPSAPSVVQVDPGVGLSMSTSRPERGSRFAAESILEACPDLAGTEIELQREVDGRFTTIARAILDDRCSSSFVLRANFRSAKFRAYWPVQHEGYLEGISPTRRVRTT
ncbi:MAG: hypothetical protein M3161_05595 [Actinomycetota bacterium]|nr:hypothetical protein [Actinomycetota bacterium]